MPDPGTRDSTTHADNQPEWVLPRKRMATTVLFTDPDGRLLLVDPTYKPDWELPGGMIEDDESPWLAGRREVAEELGLDRPPGALLAVDYVTATSRLPDGLIVVFDGGVLDPARPLTLPPDELGAASFVELHRIDEYLPARQARRARAALAARATGRAVYLEDGHPLIP